MRAVKAVRPGREFNVIGRVIESYARRFGYGVVRDFTGHGIGTTFHSGLIVPHYDAAPAYSTSALTPPTNTSTWCSRSDGTPGKMEPLTPGSCVCPKPVP